MSVIIKSKFEHKDRHVQKKDDVKTQEEDILVSPIAEVFTKVAENVNKVIPEKENKPEDDGFDAADWHDTKSDSDEDFIIDEMYSDKSHMKNQNINISQCIKAKVLMAQNSQQTHISSYNMI